MGESNNKELCILNTKQLAEKFGVNTDYVTGVLCKIADFPFTRIGKRYFFEETLVYDWMKQNQGSTFHM